MSPRSLFSLLFALSLVACAPVKDEAYDAKYGQKDDQSQAESSPRNATQSTSAPPQKAQRPKEPAMIPAPADVSAPPADATKTASGLAYKVLTPGSGSEHPTAQSSVTVHYTGWTTDGKMFDSSVARGETISFPLNGVIAGWTEGVQFMVPGEKTRFWIPGDLAYGETPRRPGAPAGMLVFDIELFSITNPPTVPEDVAAPPADAKTTASGLAYKVLTPGSDGEKPGPESTVTVHYSGWTKDGRMFDSSVMRGETISFPLNRVIPGWTEGLQLMSKGEKTRFWIPAELAYGETPARPGAPAGMLVFDVELFEFR